MFNCNCRWAELVIGAAILIVTLWPSILGAIASRWIVIIAAAILVLHSVFHHRCGCAMCAGEGKVAPSSRKKRR